MAVALAAFAGGDLAVSKPSWAGEFSPPTNTVGFANCFGEVQVDGHFGSIELSRSERFDFSYQFSTYEGANSPLFGHGFFVPLLEARLIDHDHFLEYTTLGGSRRFVYRLPADPDQYVSLDGRETAQRVGKASFVRTSSDGYRLSYSTGRLEEFETPRGTRIQLSYDEEGACRTVTSSAGGSVLGVARTSADRARLTNATGAFELAMQPHYNSEGESTPSVANDSHTKPRTLLSVTWPDGKMTRFDYSEPGVTPIRMTMSYADSKLEFEWGRGGEISRAGEVVYSVSGLSRSFDADAERITAGTWSVRRSWPDGDWKRYSFDEDNGIIDESSRSEDHIRTYLIPNRGPTYNYIRKRVRFRNKAGLFAPEPQGKGEAFYESFYDSSGQLIRELIDGRVYWHLHPGGLDQSVAAADDNFFVYDSKGRLTLRRVEGTYTRITWQQDGSRRIVCRYPWGEVTLRHYGPDGQPAKIPAGDRFPEKASARVASAGSR